MEEFFLKRVDYDVKSTVAKAKITYKNEEFVKNIEKPGGSVLSPDDLARTYVNRANNGLKKVERNGEAIEDFFEKCENAYLDDIVEKINEISVKNKKKK